MGSCLYPYFSNFDSNVSDILFTYIEKQSVYTFECTLTWLRRRGINISSVLFLTGKIRKRGEFLSLNPISHMLLYLYSLLGAKDFFSLYRAVSSISTSPLKINELCSDT